MFVSAPRNVISQGEIIENVPEGKETGGAVIGTCILNGLPYILVHKILCQP
jgi:hypothetical protein